MHTPDELQQQSAGKHAHIPEQLMQSRYAMQQYMDHGHMIANQIQRAS